MVHTLQLPHQPWQQIKLLQVRGQQGIFPSSQPFLDLPAPKPDEPRPHCAHAELPTTSGFVETCFGDSSCPLSIYFHPVPNVIDKTAAGDHGIAAERRWQRSFGHGGA